MLNQHSSVTEKKRCFYTFLTSVSLVTLQPCAPICTSSSPLVTDTTSSRARTESTPSTQRHIKYISFVLCLQYIVVQRVVYLGIFQHKIYWYHELSRRIRETLQTNKYTMENSMDNNLELIELSSINKVSLV
jgi:hypothetical protein